MINQVEEFSAIMPQALILVAYRANSELAWRRNDALMAVNFLETAGINIIGVEVWVLASSGGAKMTGRDWEAERRNLPDQPRSARDFVFGFQWGRFDSQLKEREPFFNFTTAERRPE